LPNGDLAVVGEFGQTIRIWDVSSTPYSLKATISIPYMIMTFIVLTNGEVLTFGADQLRRYNSVTGAFINSGIASSNVTCLEALENGAYATGRANGEIVIHNAYAFTIMRTLSSPVGVVSLAHMLAEYLTSAHSDASIKLWDYVTGTLLRTYTTGGSSTIKLLSIGPNELLYSLGMPSLDMAIIYADDGTLLASFNSGHTAEINGLAQLPNGNIVSVSEDMTCKIRNNSYSVIRTVTESGRLLVAAGLNDGRLVISGCIPATRIFSP
jgi:WD40 repeat protein